MSLLSYKRPTRSVSIGKDQSFNVHGLTSSDFRMLIEGNLAAFDLLFSVFDRVMVLAKTPDSLGGDAIQEMALVLVKNVPQFAPVAIALGVDEEGDFEQRLTAASSLPMPVQLTALIDIAALTFEEVGGIKKFLEKFKGLMPEPTTRQKSESPNKKKLNPPSSSSTTE